MLLPSAVVRPTLCLGVLRGQRILPRGRYAAAARGASAGQAYATASNARRAAAAFKANAGKSTFEVYADTGGKHRWRATARNGQTVATGGEAFGSQSSARRAATNVQKNVGTAGLG